MVSLRSQILIKDAEISRLNSAMRKANNAIPEETSDVEDDERSPTSAAMKPVAKKGPPSPDKDLSDFFGGGGGGSFGNM